MSIIYFIVATIAYFVLHSLLAANGVKAVLTKLVPPRYYRLVYNLVAVALFVALFVLYFLVEKPPLFDSNPVLPYLGAVSVIIGASWCVGALKRYNLDEFMGLEQLRAGQKPVQQKLIIRGLNGKVRHPLYFGTLVIIWGVLLIFPDEAMLAFVLVSTIYLIIGSRLEEEKLVEQFGEAYRKYQRDVPMLLPFRWKKPRRI